MTSPLTSRTEGIPPIFLSFKRDKGTDLMVLTFSVITSPVMPSPLVEANVSIHPHI